MSNFFKGIIGGIGNIVPGLSGSALLVILGIYQDCIRAVTEIVKFKYLKNNILFLLPIGIGVIIGTVLFGNVILFLLDAYPMPTSYAFLGFLVGTIPLLFKEANKEGFNIKYLIPVFITFLLGISLLFLKSYNGVQAEDLTFMQSCFLGFVLSGSTVIPGISSTVLLNLLGFYDYYLNAISKIDIFALFPIMIGLGIGAIMFVFLLNFLLKKYYGYTYYAVAGFCIATIPSVVRGRFAFNLETLISVVCAILAFLLTNYIGTKIEKKNQAKINV